VLPLPKKTKSAHAFCYEAGFIIRPELSSGLLFARGGTPAWELDPYHTDFLRLLYLGSGYEQACSAVEQIHCLEEFQPEVEILHQIGVLTHTAQTQNLPESIFADLLAKVISERSKAQKLKCLAAPSSLTLYVTMKCQQDCGFCFLSRQVKALPQKIGLTDWFLVMEQAFDMGVPGLAVLGGEPALYPHLPEIIKKAGELNLPLALTTNGLFLPESLLVALEKNPNSLICLSLESPSQKLHEKIVGQSDHLVFKNLQTLSKRGIRFNVNTIGLGQPIEDLKAIYDLCAELGAEVWFLNLLYRNGRSETFFPGNLWYAKTDQALRSYVAEKNASTSYQLFGCQLYWTYTKSQCQAKTHPTRYNKLISGCSAGAYPLEILPTGEVLPCINLPYPKYVAGNITENRLEDIWLNSPVLNDIRHKTKLPEQCLDCHLAKVCQGGCLARRIKPHDPLVNLPDRLCPVVNQEDLVS
jgi:pyrroloquinoline quinone biosynthesis protein E